jgi:hypothetical protein
MNNSITCSDIYEIFMKICGADKSVFLEVKNFMLNVPDVKEESITDYLVWKWRELNARFKYINVSTFTRQEESTKTGADFELELWLIWQKFHFPLVFQAKKLDKKHNSYVTKLKYPAKTQKQLNTLLSYAKTHNKLPFYAFYSIPDSNTQTMCYAGNVSDTAIFIADAHKVKAFADGKHGNRVSKYALLKATNPFHCMFCCPLTLSGYYFTSYFSELTEGAEARDNEKLPNYVSMLLDGRILELSEDEMLSVINQNELRVFRAVGVYDMRDLENEPNPAFERDAAKAWCPSTLR